MTVRHRNPNAIRADFSAAMSEMYRDEVPAYCTLVDIVTDINAATLASDRANVLNLTPDEDTQRISQERHGAIRLGTADELATMARVFAVMGMHPVGYYDLSVASVPVHSTAFRPITREDLAYNPFRVFTSLLRLELIEDAALREMATATLAKRQIFTDRAIALTEKAEAEGGLTDDDAVVFVVEVLETFRWHSRTSVDLDTFKTLNASHRLTADVVSFRGPHINHLTPRTLDIEAAQQAMIDAGLPAKAVIEGPPRRRCPILLRQTSFKALEEAVSFPTADGTWAEGHHTARFGEIEQRGIALTRKGRALYDRLLAEVRDDIAPNGDGSNNAVYEAKLHAVFSAFPDTWREIYDQELAFFKFSVSQIEGPDVISEDEIGVLLDTGTLTLSPIIYEDFLPISAAGIFQSNLGDEAKSNLQATSNLQVFEEALGKPVTDEFALYAQIETASITTCLEQLNCRKATA